MLPSRRKRPIFFSMASLVYADRIRTSVPRRKERSSRKERKFRHRRILSRAKAESSSSSLALWRSGGSRVGLSLVLLVSLIWMRQSMIDSNRQILTNIQERYDRTGDVTDLRRADEQFIREQMNELDRSDQRTVLMATGMFVFTLGIMLTNYSYMNKRTRETEQMVNVDPMTGVKSKHAYMTREGELNAAIREGKAPEFAVAVCDVNGLKHVNDTLGHQAGDDYIRSASKLICGIFQHSPVFRIGGDEFVVIQTGQDYANREMLMAELHRRSEENIGKEQVVVSAGIAVYRPGEDMDFHSVFQRADGLMYNRKQQLKAMGARTR